MPTVGGKKFPYTAAGRSAAKRHAAKTGKRMTENKKKKKRGTY
mgnify:CR=1 FL=1|jgi:hypothetical protein|tara:strand:+ start:598 stop:726 length:129 start_codon:yes stop_codon:yes gene_type:complete